MSNEKPKCPHCGSRLLLWESPEESSWGGEEMRVCFNDECPYYERGWKWMAEKYQQNASYRYCLSVETGKEYPLPVWSKTAHKEYILED